MNIINFIAARGFLKFLPDEVYLKLRYRATTGTKLNLKNPQTFNEKLQWLKLYDRKPEYTKMVDKYEVKKYVADLIGEEYIIPTLGVWDKFEDIDFDKLPNEFVLKCTHDSGGLAICKDKSTFDFEKAKQKITKSLKNNYYYWGREWPYKNVKPRIIAEKYMVDESGYELKDYKLFCFNGKTRAIQVDFDRYSNHKRNLFTPEWELMDLSIQYSSDFNRLINKPSCLEEIVFLGEKLSKNIPHVRVDLYVIKAHIYFGELTFFHGTGLESFNPEPWNYTFGSWINLDEKGE